LEDVAENNAIVIEEVLQGLLHALSVDQRQLLDLHDRIVG